MAKIIFKGKEIDVPDGSDFSLMSNYGIIFGCSSGLCGVCSCKIKNGMENLSPKTENEDMHSLQDNERLLCQCKIKQGTVELEEG